MTGRKHGLVGTPEYGAWHSMKCRCHNQRNKDYANYGGRGKVDGIVRRKS